MSVYPEIEFEVPTWNQLYKMLLKQARKIQVDGHKPDIIVGISRGGTVPSRILSDLLEVKDLLAIQIEYYERINQTKPEPILKQCLSTNLTDTKILLVDDISDSGESLQLAKSHLEKQGAEEIKISTLYAKTATKTKPDYCEKQTSRWIVFPWDTRETIRKIIENQGGKCATGKEIDKLVKAGLPKQLAEKFLKEMQ